MQKIIFINSHPIQYFAPMYKYMNEQGLSVDAWYGSSGSTGVSMDKEFGVEVKWDIPLLEGYNYRFFKNLSYKPSHSNGFWGLVNLSMVVEIFRIPKSIIVVHGWHYFTHFLIIMLGKLNGHTICIRNDMPLSHEQRKVGWKQKIKYIGLKYILFPRINYFLFIGTQNRLFYKSYKIADEQLLSCPYAVDNDRFTNSTYDIAAIKEKLQIPREDKVILFSAKYIDKKRPMDLLKAFKNINNPHCWLLMVGEGKLRKEMEGFIAQHQLKNVLLTGFINQSLIAQYYAVSDVFVMCSTVGESWGLSANEAMNYNLPLVLSDLTGSADDLVINGVNGYVFKTGDVDELTLKIKDILFNNKLSWKITSKDIVKNYSYQAVVENIRTIL
ncbi:glycosyltransferase family 4 protein [Spirosoma areae]